MRGLIAWTIVAISVLSLWWTTRKARALLRQALGRDLGDGEEMSLKSWMQASDASLETAARELERDPFERCLRFLASLGFRWTNGHDGNPPDERIRPDLRRVTSRRRRGGVDVGV